MTKLSRIVSAACALAFYWFAFKTIVMSLAICHGWHRLHSWNPLVILADGGIAVGMYALHHQIERLQK